MRERAVAHIRRAQEYLENETLKFGVRAPTQSERTINESCADIITNQLKKGGYRHSSSRTFISRLHHCALENINMQMRTFMHLIKKYSVFKSDEDYARRYQLQLTEYRRMRDAIEDPFQKAISADIDQELNLVNLKSVHDMLMGDKERPPWVLSKDGLDLAVLNFAYGKKDHKSTILFAHPTRVSIGGSYYLTESGAKHAPIANMLDEQYLTGTVALMSYRHNTMKRVKMFVSPQSGIWQNKKLRIMQNWSQELPTIRKILKWFPNSNGTETENFVSDVLDIFSVALVSHVISRKFSFIDISNCLVYRILQTVVKHMTLNEESERFCETVAKTKERFCNVELGSEFLIRRLIHKMQDTAEHKELHMSRWK